MTMQASEAKEQTKRIAERFPLFLDTVSEDNGERVLLVDKNTGETFEFPDTLCGMECHNIEGNDDEVAVHFIYRCRKAQPEEEPENEPEEQPKGKARHDRF